MARLLNTMQEQKQDQKQEFVKIRRRTVPKVSLNLQEYKRTPKSLQQYCIEKIVFGPLLTHARFLTFPLQRLHDICLLENGNHYSVYPHSSSYIMRALRTDLLKMVGLRGYNNRLYYSSDLYCEMVKWLCMNVIEHWKSAEWKPKLKELKKLKM